MDLINNTHITSYGHCTCNSQGLQEFNVTVAPWYWFGKEKTIRWTRQHQTSPWLNAKGNPVAVGLSMELDYLCDEFNRAL